MSISSRLPGKAGTTVKVPPKPNAAKKPAPVGTDCAISLPTAKGKTLHLTYWDLWFALIAARNSDGDLLRLAKRLADDKRSLYSSRDSAGRKQDYLQDPRCRLASAGVTSRKPVTWCEPKSAVLKNSF
jgi:hypothetical protein